MKNYSSHSLFILFWGMFGVALLSACESSLPVQGSTLCEDAEGQYLVIFHERWQGVRTSEVAEEVRAFTDEFIRDKELPADSVTTRFEFALRGFTAWIDAETAEYLQKDSRVNYVEENRCFSAISFSTPEKQVYMPLPPGFPVRMGSGSTILFVTGEPIYRFGMTFYYPKYALRAALRLWCRNLRSAFSLI